MNQIEHIMKLADSFAEYRDHSEYVHDRQALRAAIEQALAVQPKQEPVALVEQLARSHSKCIFKAPQPQREWVELTDDEIEDCWDGYLSDYQLQQIREISVKLREKNRGTK
jgi:hypothetical protein